MTKVTIARQRNLSLDKDFKNSLKMIEVLKDCVGRPIQKYWGSCRDTACYENRRICVFTAPEEESPCQEISYDCGNKTWPISNVLGHVLEKPAAALDVDSTTMRMITKKTLDQASEILEAIGNEVTKKSPNMVAWSFFWIFATLCFLGSGYCLWRLVYHQILPKSKFVR